MHRVYDVKRLAATLLGFGIGRLADFQLLCSAAQHVLAALALVERFAGYDAVDFCKDVLEGEFDVGGVQGGRLDEGQVVVACGHVSIMIFLARCKRRTSKLLRLLGRHRSEMPQIALISHKHNDNVRICVVAQLLQPSGHILVCLVLAYIVDEQRADRASVVGRRNSPVPLLACCVPDLGFDRLGVDLDAACRELDADGRLGVEVELVACEAAQQVGFTDPGISDQDHCGGLAGEACIAGWGGRPLKRNCAWTVST